MSTSEDWNIGTPVPYKSRKFKSVHSTYVFCQIFSVTLFLFICFTIILGFHKTDSCILLGGFFVYSLLLGLIYYCSPYMPKLSFAK
jgi:hypothetical protein